MNAVHRALRERTAAAHARVDTLYARFDLADRAQYAAMLSAHAEVLGPAEATLDEAGAALPIGDWPARRRSHLLRADLAALGKAPGEAPREEQPGPAPREALAGALYVLEGSRLGGRFLARALTPGFPRAYLDADQPTEKWRDLLSKLESILYSPQKLDCAVDAALEVFDAFEAAGRKWLAKVGVRGVS